MKRDRVIKDVLHYYDAENHKYVPYSLEALTESITNYEYEKTHQPKPYILYLTASPNGFLFIICARSKERAIQKAKDANHTNTDAKQWEYKVIGHSIDRAEYIKMIN